MNQVLVSKKAWKMGGSKMFIKVGDTVSVQNLIRGIIVDSGNDASMALAQYTGGSVDSFVAMMNQTTALLHMTKTHFMNPTGLPEPGHITTAYDLALLARAIMTHFPQQYHFFNEKWFTYNKIRQNNRNRLLWRYPDADGLKTGHTNTAGYCLIASAKKNGMRLISVVLGAPSDAGRTNASIALLRYGFRFYETHKLYQHHDAIQHLRIWYGKTRTIPAGLAQDFYITIPRNQPHHITINLTHRTDLYAPIKSQQPVGHIDVTYNGKVIASRPLITFTADARGNLIRRSIDAILYRFHHWFSKKSVAQHRTIIPLDGQLPTTTQKKPTN